MRKSLILTLAVLLLSTVAYAGDDDRLVQCAAEPEMVAVKFYPSRKALVKAYRAIVKQADAPAVEGFTTYSNKTGINTLHVLVISKQSDRGRLRTLGHELLHAVCNDWHRGGEVVR